MYYNEISSEKKPARYYAVPKFYVQMRHCYCSQHVQVKLVDVKVEVKAPIVPGALVQCDHCSGKMKPTSCIMKLECVVEFNQLKVNLPINVLTKFFGEETMQTLKDRDELIVEKLLSLQSIDYDHRNIITSMKNH